MAYNGRATQADVGAVAASTVPLLTEYTYTGAETVPTTETVTWADGRQTTYLLVYDGSDRLVSRSQTPTLTAIDPESGAAAGGEAFTLVGSGFLGATAVTFDPAGTADAATDLVVVDNETITGVTPAHAAATVDVQVEHPGGASGTVEFAFE